MSGAKKAEKPAGAPKARSCAACRHYDAGKSSCPKIRDGVTATCTVAVPPEVHRVRVCVAPDFGCLYWAK